MSDKLISPLASKEYHLLFWMYQHQTETTNGPMLKFSQADLAIEYNTAPATINKWLNTLRKVQCVESPKRGNYRITDTGYMVIAKMGEIEYLIGGKNNGH